MQRVMIIGGSGSGKSTTARKLGDITGLPVIHCDTFYWQPSWTERPRNEFNKLVQHAIATDRWIFDGNYSSGFDDRLARADTVIFLDISTWTRVRRVWWRTISNYGRTRPDLGTDCPERFDFEFLFKFVAGYRTRGGRDRAIALLDRTPPHILVHHLRSPSEVRSFLANIEATQQKTAPKGAA